MLEAAQEANVHVNASCNGKGSCGKCKLVVASGEVDSQPPPLLTDTEKRKGYMLACQTLVSGDVTVRIPEEAMQRKLKIAGMGQAASEQLKGLITEIDPMLKQIPLTLSLPTLEDSVSDLERLNRGLKKEGSDVARLNVGIKVMRQFSEAVRRDNWNITASVIRRKCANEILEVRPGNDAQASLGLAIDVGTTTMTHLLLKIEPRYIRRDPYIPTVSDFPILKSGEIGLKANPIAAVFIMPGPASYVGGDIVSGVLYTGFHREDPTTLFIDIGTNCEIVLGNKEWLMTAACSARPAFEGGGIRWGMRAEAGAIEKVVIDPHTLVPELSTVGDAPARGICASGMIDLIADLLNTGIVDRSGQFANERHKDHICKQGDAWAYVLAFADETELDEDIVFTESDLKNLIYSKGAVYAGFTTLLGEAGFDFSMVDRIIITGGFGQYLSIVKAVAIGLLPDIDCSKFIYMGNSSIVGAYMALLSTTYRQEAREICNSMTYVDFSSNPRYMDEFTSALFLSHTDLEKFPSVENRN